MRDQKIIISALERRERRNRMIAAYLELAGDARQLPGHTYGACKQCGAMIEWVKTRRGKWQAVMPNKAEPHVVHCGRNRWTERDWDKALVAIEEKERRHNADIKITVPDGKSVRTLTPEAARLHLKRSAEASDVKPDNGEETLPWD
jgi:hypothetical protein